MIHALGINRWQVIVIGSLLLALLALTIAGAIAPSDNVPYDPDASHLDGLLALRLWLEEMGYQTNQTSRANFSIPQRTTLLFSFPGALPFTTTEADRLHDWISGGGTLVLVGPAPYDTDLATRFSISIESGMGMPGQIRQLQPILPDVPSAWSLYTIGPYLNIEAEPASIAVLGVDQNRVTAAYRQLGEGQIWHLSPTHDLRNQALHDEQQAWILPALLRTVPTTGIIMFDTYHILGETQSAQLTVDSLRSWLYSTPQGWSLLITIGLTLLYLISQGVRLGPPLESSTTSRHRSPSEHVFALAALQQRAHQRDAVANYHRQRLLAHLAAQYAIQSQYSDADGEIIARVEQHEAMAEQQKKQIIELLTELRNPGDDRQLINLVAHVDDVLAVRKR